MNTNDLRFRPNAAIFQLIQLKKYRFGDSVLDPFARELAFKEYQRCENLLIDKLSSKKILEDDITLVEKLNIRLQYVLDGIKKLEEDIKPDLVQAAEDIIRDIYNIPPHIKCQGDICSNITMETVAADEAATNLPEDFDEQVKKRLLLNFIPHGSTMHIFKTAHHLIKKNISENLFKLYEEYTAILGWLLWQKHPISFMAALAGDEVPAQGKSQVKFDKDGGATVHASAVNFPVMLHEFNKGVMDYLICGGLPQQYSPSHLEVLYSHADEHSLEPWYYFLSPGIWGKILKQENVPSSELPAIVNKLSQKNLLDIENYFLSLLREN